MPNGLTTASALAEAWLALLDKIESGTTAPIQAVRVDLNALGDVDRASMKQLLGYLVEVQDDTVNPIIAREVARLLGRPNVLAFGEGQNG